MNKDTDNNYPFLHSEGEMGEIIQLFDWEKTSIGTIENWPNSLKTTVGIILHSAFPNFLFWGDDLLCFYNDAYRPSLGVSGKHPLVGKKAKEVWAEMWDFIGPLIDEVLKTGKPVSFKDQLIPFYRNGEMEDVYWTFCYSAVFDDDGKISGVFVNCTETTESVVNSKKLEENDRRLRTMIAQAPVSIGIFSGKNYVTEIANDLALQLWGRTAEEVLNKPILEAMPELENQGIKELIDHVYDTGITFSASELPVKINRNGKLEDVHINFSYEALYNHLGEVDGIMAIGIEVTDQVIARQKIQESESKFRAMADNIPNLAWMAEAEGSIYWYNQKWYDYTGTTLEQMQGWGWQSVHDPEILPEVMEKWSVAIAKGEKFEMVFPLKSAENKFGYFLTRVVPVFDDKGVISKWFGTNTDITKQIQVQKELEESEKTFRLLADSMPQHIWTSDPQGNLNYFNQSVFDYSGMSLEKINEVGWIDIVHPEDRDKNVEHWIKSITTGKEFNLEHRFRRHDGEYRWQLSRAKPQKDALGNIRMWVGSSTDIHDQKRFSEALEKEVSERTKQLADNNLELEKMNKELQSFAYISSHDLQEPLRKIQTFANRISEKESETLSQTGKDLFKRIQNSAVRMQALIEDLLAYSRTHNTEHVFEKVDLKSVLEKVKEDLHEEILEKNAMIEIANNCDLNIIPFQFHQLFYNLLSNSLKFAKVDEKLLVTIDSKIVLGDNLNFKNIVKDKNYCHITYQDNGIGFDQKFAEKIFELFQKLHDKTEYRGTGIGLAIVKKIVENHHGNIQGKGELGKGATFEIFVPVE